MATNLRDIFEIRSLEERPAFGLGAVIERANRNEMTVAVVVHIGVSRRVTSLGQNGRAPVGEVSNYRITGKISVCRSVQLYLLTISPPHPSKGVVQGQAYSGLLFLWGALPHEWLHILIGIYEPPKTSFV